MKINFVPSNGWIIPHFIYSFLHWWALGLFLPSGFCHCCFWEGECIKYLYNQVPALNFLGICQKVELLNSHFKVPLSDPNLTVLLEKFIFLSAMLFQQINLGCFLTKKQLVRLCSEYQKKTSKYILSNLPGSWAWWHVPIIPATQQA
jgi:hypothetical protein